MIPAQMCVADLIVWHHELESSFTNSMLFPARAYVACLALAMGRWECNPTGTDINRLGEQVLTSLWNIGLILTTAALSYMCVGDN